MKALFYLQGAGCVFEDTFFTVQVNRLFFYPSRRNELFRPTEYYIIYTQTICRLVFASY